MAAGASLNEGSYREGSLSDDEMWSTFAGSFPEKSKASHLIGGLETFLVTIERNRASCSKEVRAEDN